MFALKWSDIFGIDKTAHIVKAVKKDYEALQGAIQSFNGESATAINRKELDSFPLGKWVVINDKVKVRKRKSRFGDYLNFDTIVEEGGEFGKHFHDDLIESTEIIYGSMTDLKDGEVYNEGDVMHWENGINHTPIATKKTRVHVLFKSPR